MQLDERKFLDNQKRARKVIIGGINLVKTTKLQKKMSREESIQQGQSNQQCNSGSLSKEDENDDIEKSDEEYTVNLQWLVCLLHANKLPLRHLFFYI